ncbi:MAG: hypothetical protein AM326_07405 [Candidatus Thorarchaeota archaeon SMTZ-45]|nr:MAG: hypothetical protein AM326_07405 [Candidatus Thorarchaeota archaeon SMTZ-45]
MTKGDMTQARVLKIEKGGRITLPEAFVDRIGQQYGLAILVVKDGNVKLYPVDSSTVMYLKLVIEKLSKSFLEELTMVFMEVGLEDILFTSGICQAADQCFYECYFTPKQLNVEVSNLKDRLQGITGVKEVLLNEVQTSG